jgi:hypothetical protein
VNRLADVVRIQGEQRVGVAVDADAPHFPVRNLSEPQITFGANQTQIVAVALFDLGTVDETGTD